MVAPNRIDLIDNAILRHYWRPSEPSVITPRPPVTLRVLPIYIEHIDFRSDPSCGAWLAPVEALRKGGFQMGLFLRLAVVLFLVLVMGRGREAAASSLTYLQMVSDRFQKTVDVYTDADAAGNHFAARGEFDNLQADRVATMDEISTAAPCLGITCITATFDPGRAVWGAGIS